jgi:predicted TIM-barrel fold metal-dependent hydrolase
VSEWPRRRWIKFAGSMALTAPLARSGAAAPADAAPDADDLQSASAAAAGQPAAPAKTASIPLTEFEPRSVLRVPETRVDKARFPVIDVHTHLTGSNGPESIRHRSKPESLLPVMDAVNLKLMINLTGGRGKGLAESIQTYDRAHPGRFVSFTEPSWPRASEPGYAKFQADEIAAAHKAGARGLKVLKTLGLYLRDGGPKGTLVKVDDPRFDPMWEACGALKMPVMIHIADPEAFFTPIDRHNERYEELHNHPDWSFYGPGFPSFDELLQACDRVFARHPKTTFVALHVGHNAENLSRVAQRLDKHPNMHVELGARIGELGRQPRTARKFFDKYQDRILFGTDATPNGVETPQQLFGEALYRIYFRFLETEDEYFDYAPAAIPPQGRWRIYGIGLPDPVLRKVYNENATRVLGL